MKRGLAWRADRIQYIARCIMKKLSQAKGIQINKAIKCVNQDIYRNANKLVHAIFMSNCICSMTWCS